MIETQAGTRRQLRNLLATRARRTGEITLSTGAKSNFYFDCKAVTLHAEGAYLTGLAFLDALDQLPEASGCRWWTDARGGSDRERDDRALAGARLPDPGLLRPTAAEGPRYEAPHRESRLRREPRSSSSTMSSRPGGRCSRPWRPRARPAARSSERWRSSTARSRTAPPTSAAQSSTSSRSSSGGISGVPPTPRGIALRPVPGRPRLAMPHPWPPPLMSPRRSRTREGLCGV